jgi:hypothetical protein
MISKKSRHLIEARRFSRRGPQIQPPWTVIDEPLESYYAKAPSIFAYRMSQSALEDQIRHEVEVREILRQNPHRNVPPTSGAESLAGVSLVSTISGTRQQWPRNSI